MGVSEIIAWVVAATGAIGSILTLMYTHKAKAAETAERLEKNRTTKINNDEKILNFTLGQLDKVSNQLDEVRELLQAKQTELELLRRNCIEIENRYRQEVVEKERQLLEKDRAIDEREREINELRAQLRKYLPHGGQQRNPER